MRKSSIKTAGAKSYCDEKASRLMPDQSTPEIDRLRMLPTAANPHVVPLPAAIQAVRDTEDRTVREIVEALRERVLMRAAADFIERTFLNGEGSDA